MIPFTDLIPFTRVCLWCGVLIRKDVFVWEGKMTWRDERSMICCEPSQSPYQLHKPGPSLEQAIAELLEIVAS